MFIWLSELPSFSDSYLIPLVLHKFFIISFLLMKTARFRSFRGWSLLKYGENIAHQAKTFFMNSSDLGSVCPLKFLPVTPISDCPFTETMHGYSLLVGIKSNITRKGIFWLGGVNSFLSSLKVPMF